MRALSRCEHGADPLKESSPPLSDPLFHSLSLSLSLSLSGGCVLINDIARHFSRRASPLKSSLDFRRDSKVDYELRSGVPREG